MCRTYITYKGYVKDYRDKKLSVEKKIPENKISIWKNILLYQEISIVSQNCFEMTKIMVIKYTSFSCGLTLIGEFVIK